MRTYTGNELDAKIHKFLAKQTQRFPELQRDTLAMKVSKQQHRSVSPLEKASMLWSQYIHA